MYIDEIVDICGSELDEYRDPRKAQGWCLMATTDLAEMVGWDGVGAIYTSHDNDPVGRFNELQQHSDHYALYVVEDDLVLDFTMRQFDSRSPFPYIGTIEQWKSKLSKAWDYEELQVEHKVVCKECEFIGCSCLLE